MELTNNIWGINKYTNVNMVNQIRNSPPSAYPRWHNAWSPGEKSEPHTYSLKSSSPRISFQLQSFYKQKNSIQLSFLFEYIIWSAIYIYFLPENIYSRVATVALFKLLQFSRLSHHLFNSGSLNMSWNFFAFQLVQTVLWQYKFF